MWGIIIALISGTLMSVQGVFNTGVTKETSVWIAAGFVQFSALLVCIAAWFFTGKEGTIGDLWKIDNKYMLLGGVIGAFITYTVIKAMELLGPAKSVMLIVTAQVLIAYIIELMGIWGVEKVEFQWRKLVGLVIAIAGIITFKWE